MSKVARKRKRTAFQPADHAQLSELCDNIMAEIRNNWVQGKTVEDVCAVWSTYPSTPGAVANFEALKMPKEERFQFVLGQVIKRKAYAVLLVERSSTHIHLLFESLGGSAGWFLPIQGPPGSRRIGKLRTSTNQDSLGILWRPSMGQC